MLRSPRTVLIVLSVAVCIFVGCSKEEQKRKALASGDAYAASGKYESAILEYRRAVQFDERDGDVRLRLSRAYMRAGSATDGLREMIRAADLLPGNADVQITVGNLLLAAEKFEDARSRADRVLQREPKNINAHLLRANAMARLKDLDGALKDMQQAITADPSQGAHYAQLGGIQLARGERAQAEDAFLKALEVQPNAVDLRLSYANFLMVSGRLADAEREFKRAYELDVEGSNANRALASFYVMTGRPASAEAYLKKLATKTDGAWAGFALARLHAATGNPDQAIAVLKGLIANKDTSQEAKLQLAALFYGMGRRDDAHRLVEEVLAEASDQPRALVLKAGFLLDEDKPLEAITAARAARKQSRATQAAFLLGLAYSKIGQIDDAKKAFTDALALDPGSIGAQIELSRLALLTGDPVWAQRYGEQALRAAPQLPAAREAVVRGALARGDVDAAGPPLAALRRDRPNDPEFLYLEGELRLKEGKPSAARQAFAKAAELEPRSLATVEALIRLDLSERNVAAARARAERVLARSPKNPAALMLAARTYATTSEFTRAEALLRQAIDVDPTRSNAYGMLANLYFSRGKLDEALKKFQDAAVRDPNSVGVQTMIATVLTQMGRRPEAKAAYRQALAVEPEAAVAANNLAFMYAEDGENLDTAQRLAETAKRRLKGSANAIDTLGWVYYKRRMPTYAISELQNATAGEPQNASFHYHLALAYVSGGDATLARSTLERALSLDAKSPLAAEANAALASLENKAGADLQKK